MTASLLWPGVYVEEVPSGVHSITGVPTSITAFVGRALRGPTNTATTITSFADFGRQFGGLALGYPMSYAVRDFFANGGGQAVIVRVWAADSAPSPSSSSSSSVSSASSGSSASSSSALALAPQADGIARINLPNAIGLALEAQSPGIWGDDVQVQVVIPSPAPDATVAANLGYMDPAQLFSLLVTDTGTGTSETISNVSIVNGLRRIDQVLVSESQLVQVPTNPTTLLPVLPATTPGNSVATFLSGGSDGDIISEASSYGIPDDGSKSGINALDNAGIFNLLSVPPDSAPPDSMSWVSGGALYQTVYQYALTYCQNNKAFLVVDPPYDWTSVSVAKGGPATLNLTSGGSYGALYFPMLVESDPLQQGRLANFPPSGAVCGIMATTDNTLGVWKAPAGIATPFAGVQGLSVALSDGDNGQLNPIGVNCLRNFPFVGNVAWGSRTLRGADVLSDDYKYVPVRRLALYLEQSLQQGLQWVVFEPNAEPLWASIRLNVQSFMQDLFLKNAFAGTSPSDAYLVKCDSETTTSYDQSAGVVNILVGFAPLYPAEFVVLQIQQLAGQTGP